MGGADRAAPGRSGLHRADMAVLGGSGTKWIWDEKDLGRKGRVALRRPSASGPARCRLSQAAAAAWIPHTCFKHGPPDRGGVEVELLVRVADEPWRPTDGPEHDDWRAAVLGAGVGGRVTIEPGGQIELREVRRRVRVEPRYDAMERYLDRWGPAGRTMMRRTASVQVNIEAASDGEALAGCRWPLLHAVGPVLVAVFANSPGGPGPWSGWSSSRFGVWLALDHGRTAPPEAGPGESHLEAWARWCLDAPLLLVRRPGPDWSAPVGATFRDWIDGGPDVVPGRDGPTSDDLGDHLTTLCRSPGDDRLAGRRLPSAPIAARGLCAPDRCHDHSRTWATEGHAC